MDLNWNVMQEPRGIMRLTHFIFAIFAFVCVTEYTGYLTFHCNGKDYPVSYEYPFDLVYNKTLNCNHRYEIYGDFSGDAIFFVWTGFLALVYSIAISIIYVKFDRVYLQNPKLPLADFCATVVVAVFWLSSSAAWANGLTGLKNKTDIDPSENPCNCSITQSSFTTLNISVIFGFLNFFLWATDLWFLYKETSWFQGSKFHSTSGV
ncbi:synaptophysin-like protein 2 [Harmonia axyridis]|uniref:synaptophysin-like protein 2 n=1 Tax=Harmonia axyridis TaxID=115357 RepID=UPI001E276DD0|nr:synaptophysin-like protein 2 [Harmonia axyridis]XP_045481931.1 synaptophysin-like protein 2 [Harmonia axyridis]